MESALCKRGHVMETLTVKTDLMKKAVVSDILFLRPTYLITLVFYSTCFASPLVATFVVNTSLRNLFRFTTFIVVLQAKLAVV